MSRLILRRFLLPRRCFRSHNAAASFRLPPAAAFFQPRAFAIFAVRRRLSPPIYFSLLHFLLPCHFCFCFSLVAVLIAAFLAASDVFRRRRRLPRQRCRRHLPCRFETPAVLYASDFRRSPRHFRRLFFRLIFDDAFAADIYATLCHSAIFADIPLILFISLLPLMMPPMLFAIIFFRY
jgi:hypothetical protein